MPRKKKSLRKKKSKPKPKTSLEKEIKEIGRKIDREVGGEIEEIEQWMIERKKFLIKLAWVAGIIIVLLIVSHIYLRVKGFG